MPITMSPSSLDFYADIFSPRPYNAVERKMLSLDCFYGRDTNPTQQPQRKEGFSYVVSTDGVQICHSESIIEDKGSDEDEIKGSSPAIAKCYEEEASDEDRIEGSSQILVECCKGTEVAVPDCDSPRSLLKRRGSSQSLVECYENTEVAVPDCDSSRSLLKRRGRLLPALHLPISSSSAGSTLVDSRDQHGHVRKVTDHPHDKDSDYERIKLIGIDGEGIIDLVRNRSAPSVPSLVVRKTVKYARSACGKPIEAAILQDIIPERHNNIIRLHAFESYRLEGARYYLEYCAGGDLHMLVDQYNDYAKFLPEPFIWQTYQKLASALEFLHRGFDPRCPDRERRGICHRDIKPSNIFLRLDPNSAYPDVVLADFGHATVDFATYDPAGTALWQPPELPRHSPKGDVYSLGAVMHFLIHFDPPIAKVPSGLSESLRDMWVAAPETRRPIMEFVDEYSEELICVMLIALEPDEHRRKNSSQLLKCVNDCVEMKFPSNSGAMQKATEKWPMDRWAFDHLRSMHGRCDHDGEVEKEGEEEEGPGTKQYFDMMEIFGCCVSRESSRSSSLAMSN